MPAMMRWPTPRGRAASAMPPTPSSSTISFAFGPSAHKGYPDGTASAGVGVPERVQDKLRRHDAHRNHGIGSSLEWIGGEGDGAFLAVPPR